MSLSRLWLFLAVALPVLGSLLATMSTVDLAYHLRAGAEIIEHRALPTVDTWTFPAAGELWVDQQWGAQVLLRAVEAVGGWTGLAILRALVIGAVFAILLAIAHRRRLDARTAALLALAAFAVALPALALRPQLLGVLCFAIVLWLVTGRRDHPGRLWMVPVVVAIWANLHGSFFLGPVVLGLAWLEDLHDRVARPHRPLVIAVVSAAAACITPFGPWVWVYAVALSTNPDVTARITEWQPTSLRDVPGLLFFASALGVVVLIARRGRPTSWPTLAWLGFFFLLGLFAQRGLAWWPLAAVAAIGGVLVVPRAAAEREDPTLLRRLNVAVATTLVVAGVALLPAWRPIDTGTRAPQALLAHAPSRVTASLRSVVRPGDHVFNPQLWGSWFEYAIPEALYAIDSRTEFFPPQVWDDYEAVVAGVEGWERRLADWGVDLAVTSRTEEGLARRLAESGWTEVLRDADGAIFVVPYRTIGAVTSRTGPVDSKP